MYVCFIFTLLNFFLQARTWRNFIKSISCLALMIELKKNKRLKF